MPVSQGSAGGLPGMNLKAWAYVTGAGVLVRGYNIASVVKGATGVYTINFTAALGSADYLLRCTVGSVSSGTPSGGSILSATTLQATCRIRVIGVATDQDAPALWEFYE